MIKNQLSLSNAQIQYRETFLAQLARRVASPSTEWPTAHCWTKSSLKKLFHSIRDEISVAGAEPPASLTYEALIEWLCHLGIASQVQAEGEIFYILDIGRPAVSEADPYELLMAAKPAGVICYFSAVAFHSLTAQPVVHHHVAELVEPKQKSNKEVKRKTADGPAPAERSQQTAAERRP